MKPDRAFGFVVRGGVGEQEQKAMRAMPSLTAEEAKDHTLLLTGSSDPSLYVKAPSGNYMVMAFRDGHVIKKGHGGFETWSLYALKVTSPDLVCEPFNETGD